MQQLGRGGDDERGTPNYITPEAIVRAATIVTPGAAFSLAIPLGHKGPQTNGDPRRFNPTHRMMVTGTDYASGAFSPAGGIGFSDALTRSSVCTE